MNRRSLLRYAGGAAALAAAGTLQAASPAAAAPEAATGADWPDPVAVFQNFVTATANNDWTTLANCYAVDAVVEIPFAPPNVPSVTTGRAALLARFQASGSVLRFSSVNPVTIRRTDDPTVIVAEYTVNGQVLATGKTFAFQYATVTTIQDGEIVHARDYANPLAGAEATGQLPALFTALTGGQCT